jgi:NAD+ synthase
MNNKAVIDHIVNWLGTYAEKNRMNGFVVGISGGIDSALTSTLCALTGKETIVISMPIRQHKPEHDRAAEHITWLKNKFRNVAAHEIDLTPVFEKMEETYPKEIQDFLSMANSRARLRMTTLYAFAGHHRMLVAGTGNKVEDFGVGFYTKYGDGGVDVSPIADLMKSEVRALAAELGVCEAILKAAPTDGLWADKRTDEDQLGASYDELEWAMNYLEDRKDPNLLSGRKKEVLDLFIKLNTANQHKMNPIPVCVIPPGLK